MKKIRLLFFAIGAAFVFSGFNYEDNPTGRPGHTGSPNEQTCSKVGCHSGVADNSQGGSVVITSSNMTNWEYVPGQTYSFTVTVSEANRSTWGFAMEALKANGDNGGTLVAGTGSHILPATVGGFSRNSVTHNTPGTGAGTKSWTFNWTAPSVDEGAITLYAVGLAANGNGNSSGDHVYKISQTLSAAVGINEQVLTDVNWNIYPNPTTDLVNMSFNLTEPARVKAQVLTADGRLVSTLFDAMQAQGSTMRTADMSDLAAGNYLVALSVNGQVVSSKMIAKQ